LPEVRKLGNGAKVAVATMTDAASVGMSLFRVEPFIDLSPLLGVKIVNLACKASLEKGIY
jgi:hypothetical protein